MFFKVAHGRPWEEKGRVADCEDAHDRDAKSGFADMEGDTALVVPKETEMEALPG